MRFGRLYTQVCMLWRTVSWLIGFVCRNAWHPDLRQAQIAAVAAAFLAAVETVDGTSTGAPGTDSNPSRWNAGAIFALVWMIVFTPVYVSGIVWFWRRRDVQPIKAREPPLVVVTDIVLTCYLVVLCLQRILGVDYPCLVNIWSGYIGTVVLLNLYLWRCESPKLRTIPPCRVFIHALSRASHRLGAVLQV